MTAPIPQADFDALFAAAVAAVADEYIRVPVADSAPVVRERAFAYELYHQLRMSCAATGYTLTGELEKATHADLLDAAVERLAPDLLLHTPGARRGNFVAIEIKGGRPRASGFRKDLTSLCLLRDRFRYRRLMYLVYGVTRQQVATIALSMKRLKRLGSEAADLRAIELWVRCAGERRAESIDWSE